MPLDTVIIDSDQVMFIPLFGSAIVVARPGVIQATGKSTVTGKKVCLDGDEKKVQVPGCPYISGPYVIPGVGTLKIDTLLPNQKTMKGKSGSKPMILKGIMFKAKFEVLAPAMMPPPAATPDPMKMYPGMGQFISTNVKFKAS